MDQKYLEQIESCSACDACMDVCPTYADTKNALYSPKRRVELARKVLVDNEVDEDSITSFYTCPKCSACEVVCPMGIEVSKIVALARNRIVELGKGPLPAHKKVIQNLWRAETLWRDPAKAGGLPILLAASVENSFLCRLPAFLSSKRRCQILIPCPQETGGGFHDR